MKTNTDQVLHTQSRKMSAQKKLLKILFVLVLLLSGCGGGSGVNESLIRTQVALEAQQTALSEGLTSAVQPTATQATEPPQNTQEPETPTETPPDATTAAPEATATTGPSCTALRDLNFRAGPGTAYNPPISALSANTVVVPLAYNPVGVPGGSWVQVEHPTTRQKGWISAGAEFIKCNLDLTTLPSLTVAPPPTPVPPRAQTSNQDGTCGAGGNFDDEGNEWDCAVIFSNGFPIGFQVLKNRQEIGRGEGVESVVFRVDRNGNEIYRRRENDAVYCMFGGNGPCNLWVLENSVYLWESGGQPVEPGEYRVNIDVNLEDPNLPVNLQWNADVTIE